MKHTIKEGRMTEIIAEQTGKKEVVNNDMGERFFRRALSEAARQIVGEGYQPSAFDGHVVDDTTGAMAKVEDLRNFVADYDANPGKYEGMSPLIKRIYQDCKEFFNGQGVHESVKRQLKESVWYGDTKPFEAIVSAANAIMKSNEHTVQDDYEGWDDGDGRDFGPDLYRWAERVCNEAEEWTRYNSSNSSINGGENW